MIRNATRKGVPKAVEHINETIAPALAGIYHYLKNIVSKKCRKDATSVGVENRFVPNTIKNKEAPELLKYAIQKTDYTDQGVVGMDMDASEFFRSGKYDLDFKSPMTPTMNHAQPYF
ncbi:hypothetical protein ACRRTK_019849 [Alexandromys fortis]